ncbi:MULTISPECIES: hypothetical protein [Agrobacterium]|uniref:hypothetical protein n=1 Tax=Agrobacterium TaxID=357 RepID=UPI00289AEE07|nr:hypothetical protein [Agrobacterium sp.]
MRNSVMVHYRPQHLRFAHTHWGAAHKRDHQNASGPTALVVERQSEYAIDYDLAFAKFGYRTLFTAIPGEAGRAVANNEAISIVLIDADTVDLQRYHSIFERMRPVQLLVVFKGGNEVAAGLPRKVIVLQKPLVMRDFEREIALLSAHQEPRQSA